MKLSVQSSKSHEATFGYADAIAVYDAAEPGSEAWKLADEWLRYLQLRGDAGRLFLHATNRSAKL